MRRHQHLSASAVDPGLRLDGSSLASEWRRPTRARVHEHTRARERSTRSHLMHYGPGTCRASGEGAGDSRHEHRATPTRHGTEHHQEHDDDGDRTAAAACRASGAGGTPGGSRAPGRARPKRPADPWGGHRADTRGTPTALGRGTAGVSKRIPCSARGSIPSRPTCCRRPVTDPDSEVVLTDISKPLCPSSPEWVFVGDRGLVGAASCRSLGPVTRPTRGPSGVRHGVRYDRHGPATRDD